jgi:hypothetical protein
MTKPKTQIAEVLHLLLSQDMTSLDIIMNGVLNPTAKISQLRAKGVNILCNDVKHKNKFGRQMTYGRFTILNRREAAKIYNQINK